MQSPLARSSLFRSVLAVTITFILAIALSACTANLPEPGGRDTGFQSMSIGSPAFENGAMIPADYTCDGRNIVPPLHIGNVPRQAESLAILMQDPDAPSGTFTHWIMWNIDTSNADLPEGEIPSEAVEGRNSAGEIGYTGPCPPTGTHRYVFRLYALDQDLTLAEGADVNAFLEALEGHIVDDTRFRGVYARAASGAASSVTLSVPASATTE